MLLTAIHVALIHLFCDLYHVTLQLSFQKNKKITTDYVHSVEKFRISLKRLFPKLSQLLWLAVLQYPHIFNSTFNIWSQRLQPDYFLALVDLALPASYLAIYNSYISTNNHY